MTRWMRTAERRSRYHLVDDKPYNNAAMCGYTVPYSHWCYQLAELPPPPQHPWCMRCQAAQDRRVRAQVQEKQP
jgi:hypothetical protein